MLTQVDKAHVLSARFGGESDGEFAPGGMPISRIAEEYGTPFYLYHGEMIVERVRRVREALGTEVSYSLKANPNLAVCQLIAREGRAGQDRRRAQKGRRRRHLRGQRRVFERDRSSGFYRRGLGTPDRRGFEDQ